MSSYKESISETISQFPMESNELTAVVETECIIHDTRATTFGVANAVSEECEDPALIIEAARHNAHISLQKIKSSLAVQIQYALNENSDQNNQLSSQNHFDLFDQPRVYNHSSSKQASLKQIKLLVRCIGGRDALEREVSEKYNKQIEDLSSKEANDLIQVFK